MKITFWRLCAIWFLLLCSYLAARSYHSNLGGSDHDLTLPSVGERLNLPATMLAMSGDSIPVLDLDRTLFLIAWAGCPACKRELASYPELLDMAEQNGFATRMIVVPAQPEDNSWFLARVPPNRYVILDTLQLALIGLRSRVTPSIVIVGADAVVKATYSPSGEWPVTSQVLARVPR